jgi:hypothetical protein
MGGPFLYILLAMVGAVDLEVSRTLPAAIGVHGARQNNLRFVDVDGPHNAALSASDQLEAFWSWDTVRPNCSAPTLLELSKHGLKGDEVSLRHLRHCRHLPSALR